MNKLVLFVTLDSSTSFENRNKDANAGETTIISFGFGTSRSKMLSLLKEMPERDPSFGGQSIPSWKQIGSWLKEMESLRQTAA